jgi:uncharacterized protein (TIGR01244 family)
MIVPMKLPTVCLLVLLANAAGVAALAAMNPALRPHEANSAAPSVAGHVLIGNVSVRDQVNLATIDALQAAGFSSIIDLRPDGESPEQANSAALAERAKAAGMRFAYIPAPRGTIPAATVDALSQALEEAEGPVMIYCHSGSRAARVWALAAASRPNGPDAAAIATAVRNAGQKVDDLLAEIDARIANRKIAS